MNTQYSTYSTYSSYQNGGGGYGALGDCDPGCQCVPCTSGYGAATMERLEEWAKEKWDAVTGQGASTTQIDHRSDPYNALTLEKIARGKLRVGPGTPIRYQRPMRRDETEWLIRSVVLDFTQGGRRRPRELTEFTPQEQDGLRAYTTSRGDTGVQSLVMTGALIDPAEKYMAGLYAGTTLAPLKYAGFYGDEERAAKVRGLFKKAIWITGGLFLVSFILAAKVTK